MNPFENKHILLGVTSSIASFKAVGLASKLTQKGAIVDVVMTQHATRLIAPASFEGVTHRKSMVDVMADTDNLDALHVSLGANADLAIIAPCSANMIGKIAHGIADDKLSTTVLALRCPCIIAPAMNVHMYENPAVQDNLQILKKRGFIVREPDEGPLACGESGKGRMPEPDALMDYIAQFLEIPRVMEGLRVLVTAGPTREPIDAVRFISNPSTGKMGYACARAAQMAGAEVTLVSGPTQLQVPHGVKCIQINTAAEMASAVFDIAPQMDVIIMTAAVADFTPVNPQNHKIHKTDADLRIELKPTTDILHTLGQRKKSGQFLCGFCMETEDLITRAQHKLASKNLDLVVANSLTEPGCGFAGDTNGVTLVSSEGNRILPVNAKSSIAHEIIQVIAEKLQKTR